MDIEQAIQILKRTTFFNGRSGTADFYAAIDLAVQALQEKQERENPKPLTFKELEERYGKSVYAVSLDKEEENQWGMLRHSLGGTLGIFDKDGLALFIEREYGETWQAYDHEPKEATND